MVNKLLGTICTVTLLFGGGYWYYTALAGCDVPLRYRLGEIDARFDLTTDEARTAISTAESLWEDATERNLFTYDPDGDLVINFIYDERQERADEEEAFRETLEQKEGMSDSVKEEYENLVSKYDALRSSYNKAIMAYESRLSAYNAEVADWNEKGGAPKDVYERLEKTQAELSKEDRRLSSLTTELNTLVRRINQLGSQGNSIISDYNSLVNQYNTRFSEGDEFTQGDYEDGVINIYEFGSEEELTLVVAHEFGHALRIEHVEGDTSIMYHFMDAQSTESGLSAEDLAAYEMSCGQSASFAERVSSILRGVRALIS